MSNDLWDYGGCSDPELLTDSDDGKKKQKRAEASASQEDDGLVLNMLRPEKRRCLQKALGTRGGRRGKRTARGAALPPPPAYSDNDSDVQLVQDVAGTSATPPSQRRRPEGTSSKPATAGAQQLEPEQQARLMRAQHQLAQLKQQAELDCELESDSEVDPSPPKLQSKMPAAGTQQRQQQQPAAVGSGSGDELAGPAAGGDGKIVLKVQSSHGCRSLRMGRTDPFSKLMHAYLTHAIQEGHIPAGSKCRFVFDGDELSPEETPEGLDLEGDEIIEARLLQ